MIREALESWSRRRPVKRVVAETATPGIRAPLFDRYFMLHFKVGPVEAYAYLHHYWRSDPDRGPHDHPWRWALALPLAGGYVEERVEGFNEDSSLRTARRRRRPGLPYPLTARTFHRVLISRRRIHHDVYETRLGGAVTSWSLFVHGGFCKGWGFWRRFDGAVLDTVEGHEVTAIPYGYVAVPRAGDGDPWWRMARRGWELPPPGCAGEGPKP
jgi:hypothetical protein